MNDVNAKKERVILLPLDREVPPRCDIVGESGHRNRDKMKCIPELGRREIKSFGFYFVVCFVGAALKQKREAGFFAGLTRVEPRVCLVSVETETRLF